MLFFLFQRHIVELDESGNPVTAENGDSASNIVEELVYTKNKASKGSDYTQPMKLKDDHDFLSQGESINGGETETSIGTKHWTEPIFTGEKTVW